MSRPMLSEKDLQTKLAGLVQSLKLVDSESQYIVASAAARAIAANNGRIVNDVIEAITSVNVKHGAMALAFIKENFPFVALTYTKEGEKKERHGVKYSKKTHESERFMSLSAETLYDNAMTKPYVLEVERKVTVKKTAAEKHEAALKIIQTCEKDNPALAKNRIALFSVSQNQLTPAQMLEALLSTATSAPMKQALSVVKAVMDAEQANPDRKAAA